MPAGEAVPPGAVPLDVAPRLGGFPQREIARVALQRVGFGADALQQVGAGVARQLAVVAEAGDVKIYVAAALVGVAFCQQGGDNGQHFGDVFAGPRENVGVQDVEPGFVAVKAAGVELGDFRHRLALGQGGQDHLVAAGFHQFLAHMADVGDVLDVADFEAVARQGAAEPVGHHIGAQVADVGIAVYRGAAGVHPHHARRGRLNPLYPFGQGVIDVQHGNAPSSRMGLLYHGAARVATRRQGRPALRIAARWGSAAPESDFPVV